MHDAGPTSPHEIVEHVSDIRSDPRHAFLMKLTLLVHKSSLYPLLNLVDPCVNECTDEESCDVKPQSNP